MLQERSGEEEGELREGKVENKRVGHVWHTRG